ncbi:hypothetical protein ACQU0X_32505 [Pseudovibrio ascidiaceicola]|uniref:hypothetical protein n=1 Tax=Pseudovibrio ascidiaceicola TaxID=285279 RepID=UPI0011139E10|nr:hypothetical protein [Pseudovibrio ascidiaceicola]
MSLFDAERYEEALPAFKALAEAGNPQAARQLSKMFKLGLGASEDVNSAIDWGIRAQKLEGKGIVDAYASLFVENVGLGTEFDAQRLDSHFDVHVFEFPDLEPSAKWKRQEQRLEELWGYKFNLEHLQGPAHDFYVELLSSYYFTAEQLLDIAELAYQFRVPSHQTIYEIVVRRFEYHEEEIKESEGRSSEHLDYVKDQVQTYNRRLNQGLLKALSREILLEKFAKRGSETAQWELGRGMFLGKPFLKDERCGLTWMTLALMEGGGDWAEFEEYAKTRSDIMLPLIILRAQGVVASDYRRSVCS